MTRSMPRRNVFQVSSKMVNWILLFILVFGLSSCTQEVIHVRPKYSGDHTTAQIRGMWMICFQTRTNAAPYFPPPLHMQHCDCVVDKSRERHSSKDYTVIGSDNLTKFFTEVSAECNKAETITHPEPTAI